MYASTSTLTINFRSRMLASACDAIEQRVLWNEMRACLLWYANFMEAKIAIVLKQISVVKTTVWNWDSVARNENVRTFFLVLFFLLCFVFLTGSNLTFCFLFEANKKKRKTNNTKWIPPKCTKMQITVIMFWMKSTWIVDSELSSSFRWSAALCVGIVNLFLITLR